MRGGERVDAVLLDMTVAGPETVAIAEELRSASRTDAPAVILMTPLGASSAAVRSSGLATLAKPIKPGALLEALQSAPGRRSTTPAVSEHTSQFDTALARAYPLTILVAEDNLVNQKVATLMLGRFGFRPDIVGNGRLAVEAMRRQPYDLVLMDVHMPEMDGLEATRRIRAEQPAGMHADIVAMTASALVHDVQECLAAGMDAVVTKPVAVDELRTLLVSVGKRRGVPKAP
jgi:CheY-like chemotaxis protein